MLPTMPVRRHPGNRDAFVNGILVIFCAIGIALTSGLDALSPRRGAIPLIPPTPKMVMTGVFNGFPD